MGYVPPSLSELKEFLQTLDVPVRSKQRELQKASLKSLATLDTYYAEEEMLGALCLNRLLIFNEYTLTDPNNSALYTAITRGLKLTKDNPIDVETQILYLSRYYQLLKKRAANLKESHEIDEQFKPVVNYLLSLMPDLKLLLTSRPNLEK